MIIIALMLEAERTSETSVDIQSWTRQYIPDDSELHTRRRENLNLTQLVVAKVSEKYNLSIFRVEGETGRF
jgi:hypothetical protein